MAVERTSVAPEKEGRRFRPLRPIRRFFAQVERQPKTLIFFEAMLVAVGIGVVDFYTGWEVNMFLFYGIPILAAAWWCNRNAALGMAAICAIIWSWADSMTGHPYLHQWVRVWEPSIRFAYFGLVAMVGSALRKQHAAVRSRIALLEHSQRLERQIIDISEREQRRIGQDLHDGLCQYFAAVGCAAASLKSDLASAGLEAEAAVAGELTELLEDGVVQTRELARGLVPVQMHEAGLAGALEQLAASVSRLQNVACVFVAEGRAPLHSPDVATHLYRIAQEAIHNAIRHGDARTIQLHLRMHGARGTLSITDDGAGMIQTNEQGSGMGIGIMSYRARLVGGDLKISRAKAGGTTVTCVFPRATQAKAASNG